MPGLSAARAATATARKNTNLAITILEALKRIARLLATLVRSSAFMRSGAAFKPDRLKAELQTKSQHSVGIPSASSARGRFLPRAVLFFPIVKWFAVDLVNGRLGNFHLARLAGQKEINIVGLAVGSFHVHAGEVFAAAEVLQSIIVYFCQIERQILPFMCDVKFSVGTPFAFRGDIALNASGDISRAHLFLGLTFLRVFRTLFWVFPAFLWLLRRFLRMLRMFLGNDQRHWAEK